MLATLEFIFYNPHSFFLYILATLNWYRTLRGLFSNLDKRLWSVFLDKIITSLISFSILYLNYPATLDSSLLDLPGSLVLRDLHVLHLLPTLHSDYSQVKAPMVMTIPLTTSHRILIASDQRVIQLQIPISFPESPPKLLFQSAFLHKAGYHVKRYKLLLIRSARTRLRERKLKYEASKKQYKVVSQL